MLNSLLTHNIRKDLTRKNKKHNHQEYLRALDLQPKMRYWLGYHKKKLIFFALVALVTWNYQLHVSIKHWVMGLRSPKQFASHLFFGSEKVEKTVNEQKVIGWQFSDSTFDVLTKTYYEADKRLIFGVGRNYLFQVLSSMGMLQKPEDITSFWKGGGFHKKRNQLVSGVGYQQFMTLYTEGFKKLRKQNAGLTQQDYLRQFLTLFVQKAPQIVKWEKEYNEVRFSEYLKNLLTDEDKKSELLTKLMRQNLDITEEEVDLKMEQKGMKGMGLRDKWVFWKNRQILLSLREYSIHKKLNLPFFQDRQRTELKYKLKQLESELEKVSTKKQSIKSEYQSIYQEDLI